MPQRLRNIQIPLRVTEKEREQIEAKMKEVGIQNREWYIRKMAIEGKILWLEVPQLDEILTLFRRASNNVNQLAKQFHEKQRIYEVDVDEAVDQLKHVASELRALLLKLSRL